MKRLKFTHLVAWLILILAVFLLASILFDNGVYYDRSNETHLGYPF